jgi:DNA segregation ATPase FtsK/SpoIIIE-like protein
MDDLTIPLHLTARQISILCKGLKLIPSNADESTTSMRLLQHFEATLAANKSAHDETQHMQGMDSDDPLYEEAVELFKLTKIECGHASLQREFLIGYNRAARILERMLKDGIIERLIANYSISYQLKA